MKIKACYDNQGETIDRYTIVFNETWNNKGDLTCLALSDNPSHPQGFSMFSSCHDGPHLGVKLKFGQLPEHIKKHVMTRLNDE